jgi:AcrR family transcriptional regulator
VIVLDDGPPIQMSAVPPGGRPERADAARNRELILATARRLFAEHGVRNVSMDDIAAAAGVGKGTVYRRFGGRATLVVALLDAEHADLQERCLRGDPPLGPGVPPRRRLDAFFEELGRHLARNGDLVSEAEHSMPAGQHYGWAVYIAWHAHVSILLRELDPALDQAMFAHLLLAPYRADMYQYLTRDPDDRGDDRLRAAIDLLLDGLEAGVADGAPTQTDRGATKSR